MKYPSQSIKPVATCPFCGKDGDLQKVTEDIVTFECKECESSWKETFTQWFTAEAYGYIEEE